VSGDKVNADIEINKVSEVPSGSPPSNTGIGLPRLSMRSSQKSRLWPWNFRAAHDFPE